jgi:hypothetical protein
MDTNMPEDDCSLPLVLYTAGDGRELALVLYTAKREREHTTAAVLHLHVAFVNFVYTPSMGILFSFFLR